MSTIFSFGGGIQSTALYLMLCHAPERFTDIGLELPEATIFADTTQEPHHVYEHIRTLSNRSGALPITMGKASAYAVTRFHELIPFYIKTAEGKKEGMSRRQCTERLKIRVVTASAKATLGYKKGARLPVRSINLWLGISTDEAHRMKPNQVKVFENVYPLIELGMSRQDCLEYCWSLGVYPPKSRCKQCPYISDWVMVADKYPDQFAEAVAYDRSMRDGSLEFRKLKGVPFLVRTCLPLEDHVALERLKGKSSYDPDEFAAECSGTCGL